jgi:hypothetical protein
MFIVDCGRLTHLLQVNSTHKFRKTHVALNGMSSPFHKKDSVTTVVVGAWGSTALLVGRSRERFLVLSLEIFSVSPSGRNHVPWGRLSLWKWVPGISPSVKAAGAYGWLPTTLVVPNVEMIRGHNLPGTPSATSACCGITFTFTFLVTWLVDGCGDLLAFAILHQPMRSFTV